MPGTRRNPTAATALLSAALVACALAAAPAAHAGSTEQIVRECLRSGSVDPGAHSREDLQRAQRGLPADVAEYTDCQDVISEALAAKGNGGGSSDGGGGPAGAAAGGGGGGTGGSAPNQDPVEEQGRARNEIESTLLRRAPKVNVGGKAVEPDLDGFEVASSRNDLPLPILLVLIAVALTFAAAGAVALGRRLPALRRRLGRGSAA